MAEIRRLRAEEWLEYKRVRLRALELAPDAFGSKFADAVLIPDEEWQSRAKLFATADDRVLFAAYDGHKIVGIMACFANRDPEVVQAWVEPTHRGQKIGERLIEAIQDWASARGDKELRLWVRQENASAIALYERTGFVRTGQTEEIDGQLELQFIHSLRRE